MESRPGCPPPRRRRDPEASRAAILEAAREVFAERGYARATIREIARRAGVTHGLVMRHFGSKEQLLIEALPGPRAAAEVVPGDLATLPERVATAFVAGTESAGRGEHAVVALIRSAASDEEVAVPLYAAVEREITATFREVLGPGSEVYAGLLGSLFIGVTFARHIARTGVLAQLTPEELVDYLVPAIRALLAPAMAGAEDSRLRVVENCAITVGGRVVRDPAYAIADYLERHGGTVTHYDFRAGTFDQIDPDLIRATRSPWMGSRISAKEAAWLIGRGTTAPWAAIPLDAQLKDADPLATGGLYDRAAALWDHFWDVRPANVSTAKISKMLYLMRPGLFPILDSYLTRFYRTAARAAAIDVGQTRPSLARFRTLYWEAVRRDIVDSEVALQALRRVLPATGAPLAEQAAERLSDLRLLDMLAFAASVPRPAPPPGAPGLG